MLLEFQGFLLFTHYLAPLLAVISSPRYLLTMARWAAGHTIDLFLMLGGEGKETRKHTRLCHEYVGGGHGMGLGIIELPICLPIAVLYHAARERGRRTQTG